MTFTDLQIDRSGPVVCAAVRGDIDLSNARALRAELSGATTNEAYGLVLDLREVYYLDSAGLHLLHHLRDDVITRGQTFRLVIQPGSTVYTTLRLAGLDWRHDIVETLEAGRAAVVACAPEDDSRAGSTADGDPAQRY